MTHQIVTRQRLKHLSTPNQICNALSAILNRALIKVIKFIKELGRGKTPWLHYELPNGRRVASFISPKAFQGYWWNQERSITINKSTGAKYQVSDKYCTCRSWAYQVKTGKKSQCKHQVMRSKHIGVNLSDSLPVVNNSATGNKKFEIVANKSKSSASAENVETANDKVTPSAPLPYNPSNRYKLNPEILLDGFELERSRDLTLKEYYLKAWSKQHLKAEPELKRIGRIIETDRGFMVGGMRGASRVTVAFQADAVGWLLRYNGISYHKEILPAYQEIEAKHCPDCGQLDRTATKQINYCTLCGWSRKNTPAFRY